MSHANLNELPFRDLPMVLEAAFDGAKRRDEYQFCRALLREGVTAGDAVDPLFEARRFIHQYITLLEAPIEESLKLRLMLTLYCHSLEIHDFYHVIANLLRITAGHEYATDPFALDPRGNEMPARSVEEKASRLAEWAEAAGIEEIGDLLTETVIPELRRSFNISTYTLDESQFHFRPEAGAKDTKISLEWCLPRINRGVAVALTFIDGVQRHMQAYQANKLLAVQTEGITRQIELVTRGGVGLMSIREVPAEAAAPAAAPAPSATEETQP